MITSGSESGGTGVSGGAVVGWLTKIFRRPAEFTIEIHGEGEHRVEGSLSPQRLHLIASVIAETDLTRGTIFGVRKGGRVLLECSGVIPPNIAQRLRNVWVSQR